VFTVFEDKIAVWMISTSASLRVVKHPASSR
jgi:hypothetical protein